MTNNYKITDFTQFLEVFKSNQENDFNHFELIGMNTSSAEEKKHNSKITTKIISKCEELTKKTTKAYHEKKINKTLYDKIIEKIQRVQKVLTINKSYDLYLQQISNSRISIEEKKRLNSLSYNEIIIKNYNQSKLLTLILTHIENILNKSKTFLKFQDNSNFKINTIIIKNSEKSLEDHINIIINDLNVRSRKNLYPMTIYQLLNCSENLTIEELDKRKEIMKNLTLELKYYTNNTAENTVLNMYYTQLENFPSFRTQKVKEYYDDQISKLQKNNYKKVSIFRKIYWWFLKKTNSEKYQESTTLYNLQHLSSNTELKESFITALETIQDNIKEYNQDINIVYKYKDVNLFNRQQSKDYQDNNTPKKIEQNTDTVKQEFLQDIPIIEKVIEQLKQNKHNLLNKNDEQVIKDLTDNITELKNDRTKEISLTHNPQEHKAQHITGPKIH